MASIKDLYDKSEFSKFPKGVNLDKTPINADGGRDLSKDEKALEKARGAKLNLKKYSDSIQY